MINNQFLKEIEVFGKRLNTKEVNEIDVLKLLRDNGYSFDMRSVDNLNRLRIRLAYYKNRKRTRFLQINTDEIYFGFSCGKLCYIIIYCEENLGVELISSSEDKENIYSKFNIFSMTDNLEMYNVEEFIITHIFDYVNVINHIGKIKDKWFVCLEFEG